MTDISDVIDQASAAPVAGRIPGEPIRVGLVGFGKTGMPVASVLLRSPETKLEWVVRQSHRLGHRSVGEFLGIDSAEPAVIHSSLDIAAAELLAESPVDVVVDFSSQVGLSYYGAAAAQAGAAIVSAISHYDDATQRKLARLGETVPVLWSPNITIGINFLMLAAQTLQGIAPLADIEIVEEHFGLKPEVSGTAIRIAASLGRPPDSIKAIRAGGIIGVHEVLFGFPFQTVRLRHESISREAFGNGAIFAVKHLVGKPAGVYKMEDLLIPYFTAHGKTFELREPLPRESGLRARVGRALHDVADRIGG